MSAHQMSHSPTALTIASLLQQTVECIYSRPKEGNHNNDEEGAPWRLSSDKGKPSQLIEFHSGGGTKKKVHDNRSENGIKGFLIFANIKREGRE